MPVLSAVSLLREGPVLANTPNYHVLLAAPGKAGKELIRSPLKVSNAARSPGAREWRLQLIDYLRGNRDYLEKELRSIGGGVKFTHVEGAYLQWIDFRPLGIKDPCRWLQDKCKILPNDGKPFGIDGYVRINFGTTRGRLEEAVRRIKANI
ncbi:hypothetical protein AGMMS50268_34020 [Spirochaetia bacterium]|nr:hypothetical protein AGMMS50268_34020 [Spirochaetia bacterium]